MRCPSRVLLRYYQYTLGDVSRVPTSANALAGRVLEQSCGVPDSGGCRFNPLSGNDCLAVRRLWRCVSAVEYMKREVGRPSWASVRYDKVCRPRLLDLHPCYTIVHHSHRSACFRCLVCPQAASGCSAHRRLVEFEDLRQTVTNPSGAGGCRAQLPH